MATVKLYRQRRADGRNVAVEALADLVDAQRAATAAAAARHDQRLHEFTRFQPVDHVVDVEVFERQAAFARAAAQHDLRAQRNQHRRGVADGRAVGDVATHRAGAAHWQRGKAQPDIAQHRPFGGQSAPGVFERGRGADGDGLRGDVDAAQFGHVADEDQLAQIAHLLGDPKPHVGAAGQHACARLGLAQRRKVGQRARRVEAWQLKRWVCRQRTQRGDDGCQVAPHGGRVEHLLPSIQDGPVAGAAAEIARQIVGQLLARRHGASGLVVLVAGPQ